MNDHQNPLLHPGKFGIEGLLAPSSARIIGYSSKKVGVLPIGVALSADGVSENAACAWQAVIRQLILGTS
jgi:hypothetical protein